MQNSCSNMHTSTWLTHRETGLTVNQQSLEKNYRGEQYFLDIGIITGKCPDYLRTIVQPAISSHPGLRSAACPVPKFVTPRLRTKFGEHAFSYAGPAA